MRHQPFRRIGVSPINTDAPSLVISERTRHADRHRVYPGFTALGFIGFRGAALPADAEVTWCS